MEIKMKLIIWIFLIFVTTVFSGREEDFSSKKNENNSRKHHSRKSESENNDMADVGTNWNVKNNMDNDFESAFGSGRSISKYKHMKARAYNAKGKFQSRGTRGYGMVSSESSQFLIEETLDKYGRPKPIKSKFKTRGKKKKYSKKIVHNQFDIKGRLFEGRKYKQTGDYQANGTHVYINMRNENEMDNKLKSNLNSNGRHDKNFSVIIDTQNNQERNQHMAIFNS
ncbi:unnamed protein product [Schistosoma rodhaini]|uniref:Trematode Eggshell Synthesis domain containing protein n=1 Tax=Schistosoma rodhaini TaxID=6188 RepID=A0AA85FST8_9TREM|nr:unnamed protein product [Schistosoma rodhaini]